MPTSLVLASSGTKRSLDNLATLDQSKEESRRNFAFPKGLRKCGAFSYLPLAVPGVDPPYWDEPVPPSEVGPPTVPFGSPVFVLFVAPEPMPVVQGGLRAALIF